jgi:hypothetical protein
MSLVTVAEVCDAMGIPAGDANESGLQGLIDSAQAAMEVVLHRSLSTATGYTEYHRGGDTHIYVKRPPIVSVTSLTDDAQYGKRAITSDNWIDSTDDNGDNYAVGKVELWNTEGYFAGGRAQVKVVYQGGWDASTLPADLRQAWIELVALKYDAPERAGVDSIMEYGSAGGSVSYAKGDIPPRIMEALNRYAIVEFPS